MDGLQPVMESFDRALGLFDMIREVLFVKCARLSLCDRERTSESTVGGGTFVCRCMLVKQVKDSPYVLEACLYHSKTSVFFDAGEPLFEERRCRHRGRHE